MIILIVIVVLIVLWAILSYNRLVTLVARTKEAWADIEVQLKRRYDLIPNLVSAVKGYAAHESSAFENVTKARAVAMGVTTTGTSLNEKGRAENVLSGTLKSLFAIAESYPDLKANQNFLSLQNELADTENKVQAARRFYNGNVRDLTIAIDSFPGNMIANYFHFTKMDLFELGEAGQAANDPVNVQF